MRGRPRVQPDQETTAVRLDGVAQPSQQDGRSAEAAQRLPLYS